MKALSLFSGIMGLDIGLEQAGIEIIACCENDYYCNNTIKSNKPNLHCFSKSIEDLKTHEIISSIEMPKEFILVGGPPCQSFSTGGNRLGLSDLRGNLVLEYLRFISELQPTAFIFENVGNILTSAIKHRPINLRPGKNWNLAKYSHQNFCEHDDINEKMDENELSGSAFRLLIKEIHALNYSISFGILNSADFGAPQKRIRFCMLGFRDVNEAGLPKPTYGPNTGQPYNTLKSAIFDLSSNPGPHSIYTYQVERLFQKIPPGGNWKDLPLNDQKEALGGAFLAGGGKTGFMRRLSWDAPSPTLTTKANRKGTALCHPTETRPLSIMEYKRIQGFPDDWIVTGSMSQQYQQIGNAVPVPLGRALGNKVLETLALNQVKKEQKISDLYCQMAISVKKLRSYAINKKSTSTYKNLLW